MEKALPATEPGDEAAPAYGGFEFDHALLQETVDEYFAENGGVFPTSDMDPLCGVAWLKQPSTEED